MDHLLALRQQWDREYQSLQNQNQKFSFHVIGLPPTVVRKEPSHPCDTMTYSLRGIIRILHNILGHHVTFYGSEDSDVECDRLVVINTVKDRERWYGKPSDPYGLYAGGANAPEMTATAPPYFRFNRRVIGELDRTLEDDHFILLQGGSSQESVFSAYPNHLNVEYLIGYDGSCAPYRVFQTYPHMMYTYGRQGHGQDRDWDDAGYGFYYPRAEFPRAEQKGDYYLFMGRCTGSKGPHIAGQVCRQLGVKLIVAGQNARQEGRDCVVCLDGDNGADGTRIESPGVEYVGVVSGAAKAKLLGEARAIFCPTKFREPFCSVAMEANLCGTPVISSDHSAFVETVVPGVNGYRCRSFAQYVAAAQKAPLLDSRLISERAWSLYDESVMARRYQTYFTRLMSIKHGKGWYAL